MELIEDGRYSRTVRLGDEDGRSSRTPSLAGGDGPAFTGWLRVGHREDKTALELEISDGLGPVADEIVGRVRRQFDLDHPEDPEEQVTRLLAIKRIGPWTAGYIAMRTLGMNDVFFGDGRGYKGGGCASGAQGSGAGCGAVAPLAQLRDVRTVGFALEKRRFPKTERCGA